DTEARPEATRIALRSAVLAGADLPGIQRAVVAGPRIAGRAGVGLVGCVAAIGIVRARGCLAVLGRSGGAVSLRILGFAVAAVVGNASAVAPRACGLAPVVDRNFAPRSCAASGDLAEGCQAHPANEAKRDHRWTIAGWAAASITA